MSEAEALAVAFLDEYSRGRSPEIEAYTDQLDSEPAQDDFREILRYALTVESFPPVAVQPGSMFGQYLIGEKIGSGGMGTVYRALDTQLDRQVAIKVLPPHRAGEEFYRERFRVESKLLARLDENPNIVTVHEFGELDELRYIVMAFVDGAPLDSVLATLAERAKPPRKGGDLLDAAGVGAPDGRRPLFDADTGYWRAVALIVREVAGAVQSAHAKEVLHRDLKPANVILEAGGHPVVLDFGLAGSVGVATGEVTEGLFGSLPYLAPEQANATRAGFDFRTDVYQCGLLLYELLTLRRAYAGDSKSKVFENVKNGRFPAPRSLRATVPVDLETACLVALDPDPTRRYQSARAFVEDLDNYLAGRPLAGKRPGLARRGFLFAQRNRRPLAAAVVALVLGGGGGLWYWQAHGMAAIEMTAYGVVEGRPKRELYETVRAGETIAVEFRVPKTTHVHALSVMGRSRSRPEYVRALQPQTGGDPSPSYAIELEPGEHVVQFTIAGSGPEPGRDWYEGLWVFYSAVDDPEFTRAIEHIAGLERDLRQAAPGLDYAEAMRTILGVLSPARGGSLHKVDPRMLARTQKALDAPDLDPARTWLLDDPRLAIWTFRVE